MAEKYTSEFFTNYGFKNIYTGAKCIDLWSVHQFSGDYNQFIIMLQERLVYPLFFGQKFLIK